MPLSQKWDLACPFTFPFRPEDVLIKDYLTANFEDSEVKCSLFIHYTRCGRPTYRLTNQPTSAKQYAPPFFEGDCNYMYKHYLLVEAFSLTQSFSYHQMTMTQCLVQGLTMIRHQHARRLSHGRPGTCWPAWSWIWYLSPPPTSFAVLSEKTTTTTDRKFNKVWFLGSLVHRIFFKVLIDPTKWTAWLTFCG